MTVTLSTIEATLADLREHETFGTGRGVRTHMLDLVVFCDQRAQAEQMVEVVASLPHSRPSRAIIALGLDDDSDVVADARVFCTPVPGGSTGVQVCSEIVSLESGQGGVALPSLIAGLLLPDLPVFLHWRAEPDASRIVLSRLWELATRVVVDSTAIPRSLDALTSMIQRQPDRSVTDLSWTKITGWREAVARAFDNAENASALAHLTDLEIAHVGASDAQARLLAGWLSARTGRTPELSIVSTEDADMRDGSLTRVELTCAGERYRVTRVEEGTGLVEAPRLPEHHVPLRVPPLRGLLAQELEFLGRDRIFEQAVSAL
ncbi:MAG TPA: glucose-6-phosphate dehydrogenase assembly protein OpcA [Gaiellales bacterium]|jgi:glucose-6-phosphate dehydrogenase assembly protein OpcA